MTETTFMQTLDFIHRAEHLVAAAGIPLTIIFSGGECTDNPLLPKFLEIAISQGFVPMILSHGMWLDNKEMRDSLLRPEWKNLFVQITYDPRFYPGAAPPRINDDRITYVDAISKITPLGRATLEKNRANAPLTIAPSSFNLRSMTLKFDRIDQAIYMLRVRALAGALNGNCTPIVSHEGNIHAGETRDCYVIGTVYSSLEVLTKATCEMQCNKCGLVTGLSQAHKRAIGESTLYDSTGK